MSRRRPIPGKAGKYTHARCRLRVAMTDVLSDVVPDHLAGTRLDQALAKMFPQFSRSRLKAWLLAGSVRVDGAQWKPRDAVSGGERVEVEAREEAAVTSQPEPMTLDIVFEDSDLLVVNKPAGLVVHPGSGNTHGTLMNGLLHFDPALENLPRAGIVHRLDKDTSGLLLIGRTLESHTKLTRMLADRVIDRHYEAICRGVLTGGGRIDEPIARHPTDRTRMSVQQEGRPAVTHYTVLERFRAHTHVSVKLETGRTHQIRVHFAHRRHALLGDPVYGGRLALPKGASEALVAALRSFKRQALHAARLAFDHPASGERISLVCDAPGDFIDMLEILRSDR